MPDLNQTYLAVLTSGIVFLLLKVVLPSKSRDENLVCDHLNERFFSRAFSTSTRTVPFNNKLLIFILLFCR